MQPLDYDPHCSSKWAQTIWPGRAGESLEWLYGSKGDGQDHDIPGDFYPDPVKKVEELRENGVNPSCP